jgi:Na+/melibiose symporter-like transporter
VGLPIATLITVPMVLIGQLIDLDEEHTSTNRSAMFFGVQGLMTKWAYAASAALMSFLISKYGMSAAEPLGVQLIGPVAGAFCLTSAFLYAVYPERHVLRATAAMQSAREQLSRQTASTG